MSLRKKNKVAFLNMTPHIGAVPAALSCVSLLVKRGFVIDFFTVKFADHIPRPTFPEMNVNVIFIPTSPVGPWIIPPIYSFYHIFKIIKSRSPYNCLFGMDQIGMIFAIAISLFIKIKVIYFSVELYLSYESVGIVEKFKKTLERICNQRTMITIIQDNDRANLLIKDNRISPSQIMIIPNSSLGCANKKREYYFNEKFGISRDKKIILYAGNIISWAMSYELVKSALTWPDNYILILHGYIQGGQEKYMEEIMQLSNNNQSIIVSTDMVSYENLEQLHSSADIGVALYNPQQHKRSIDFTNIAFASGKLMHYLKSGLPILTTNLPNLKRLIDQYECGMYINKPDDIKASLEKIFKYYDNFSNQSIIAYNDQFEFTKYFNNLLKEITHWQ